VPPTTESLPQSETRLPEALFRPGHLSPQVRAPSSPMCTPLLTELITELRKTPASASILGNANGNNPEMTQITMRATVLPKCIFCRYLFKQFLQTSPKAGMLLQLVPQWL
jgi:hypothetical protein